MGVSLNLIALSIPVLAIIGVVMIVLGVRGRPVFSLPRCARCSYDLRAMNFMSADLGLCPECGASLSAPHAVNFGRLQANRRMIFLGLGLIASPWLVLVPIRLLAPASVSGPVFTSGPQYSKSLTNAKLIANAGAPANQPWDWQELQARLAAGSLSTAEVDGAIGSLTSFLNNQRASNAMQQPLSWADGFVASARTSGKLSAPAFQKLCEAFYSEPPRVKLRAKARTGKALDLEIGFNEPWDLQQTAAVWALKDARLEDGSAITVRSTRQNPKTAAPNPDLLSGLVRNGNSGYQITSTLPPGEHEVTLTFAMGVISQTATLRGFDGMPGTPDKWPSPVATWQMTQKQKITIVAAGDPVIDVVTDPKENPFPAVLLDVKQALARPSRDGVQIVLDFTTTGSAQIPLSYRVASTIDGKPVSFGSMLITAGNNPRQMMQSVKTLSPDIKSLDITLTPDPTAAEQYIEIQRIWGEPRKIENVPLERADLPREN